MLRRAVPVMLSAAVTLTALAGAALASPGNAPAKAALAPPFDFSKPNVVATGMDIPWGMAFLPDGSALVAERNKARIMKVKPGSAPQQVRTVPGVRPGGEGGLLGLALSPTHAQDGYVHVYFTSSTDNRVARLKLDSSAPQILRTGIPRANIHNGGRIKFGPDGKFWVATGDAANSSNSQNLNSLGGKILRMNADGSVPADNPQPGSRIYTLGHRNVQGLAWDKNGQLWASELGQNTWDEVNRILSRRNYGWPNCEGKCGDSRYVDPVHVWRTAEASPSGAAIAHDTLFVAALRGQRLWMVPLAGGAPTSVLQGTYGRIRTVEVAPDGWLWIATSNGGSADRIVRFPPAA